MQHAEILLRHQSLVVEISLNHRDVVNKHTLPICSELCYHLVHYIQAFSLLWPTLLLYDALFYLLF